jgi:hypothetical protein
MAVQHRGLMADVGLGLNTGQNDALMHHSLNMLPNQNRKSFGALCVFSGGARLCGRPDYSPNRVPAAGPAINSSYYDLNFTMQPAYLQFIVQINPALSNSQIQSMPAAPDHLITNLVSLSSLR